MAMSLNDTMYPTSGYLASSPEKQRVVLSQSVMALGAPTKMENRRDRRLQQKDYSCDEMETMAQSRALLGVVHSRVLAEHLADPRT